MMTKRRPVLLFAAAAMAVSAALAGCSGDQAAAPEEPEAEQPQPWPLTGELGYEADQAGPVVTVKIDDSSAGRPQVGVDSADLVVQELVEGGSSRLAVMFQSTYPAQAGPVRSMRDSDIGIVLPAGGILAASGAAPSVERAVSGAGVSTAVEDDPGFSRDYSRSAPYNLFTDVGTLAGTEGVTLPGQTYLTFGDIPQGASSVDADELTVRFPQTSSSWVYDAEAGAWIRADLEQPGFDFTSVIVLMVKTENASYRDPAGNPVPITLTEGSGEGHIATGGKVYPVTWKKAAPEAPWTFTTTDAEGFSSAIPVPVGRSWIALVPSDGGGFEFSGGMLTQ